GAVCVCLTPVRVISEKIVLHVFSKSHSIKSCHGEDEIYGASFDSLSLNFTSGAKSSAHCSHTHSALFTRSLLITILLVLLHIYHPRNEKFPFRLMLVAKF
ncbi:Uncharacterized protein FWK35_00014935, partial [Aphis craccivora]